MFTIQEHAFTAEHQGLNLKRTIRSSEKAIAEQKMIWIQSIWDKKWQRKLNLEQIRQKAWTTEECIKR